MIGRTLTHYKILKKIGSGGMGDVYLADDRKLDRKVALKVLPAELADNADRRSRFQREAKAIAALNHPHIVTVYSVEEHEGVHFITMELLEGKTLGERLPKKGFPLDEFYDIALAIADAVAAAHEEAITHRDLKPDNVMVDDDGGIKILDFGLAKSRPDVASGRSELKTQSATRDGQVMGTLAYMSPEQAEGKAVDARSDIYSMGIMFYEMVTGVRPFEGILRDTPAPVTAINPDVPRDLAKLIRRCLAHEPKRRYQTSLDVWNELSECQAGPVADVPVVLTPRKSKAWWLVATSIAFLAVGWMIGRGARNDTRLLLTNPVQVTSAVGVEDYPTWSPDGRTLAYAASANGDLRGGNWDIWVTQVPTGQTVNRTPDYDGPDRYPSWSPDGSQIAFWSNREHGALIGIGATFVMSAVGGPARKVISGSRGRPQWSSDGEELAAVVSDRFIEIVTIQTRQSRRLELTKPVDGGLSDLRWSSDGRLFAGVAGGSDYSGVSRLWVVRLEDGAAIPITDGRTDVRDPSWSADGRSLFFLSNRAGAMDLWQQPMRENGTPAGAPRPVTAGIGMRRASFSPAADKLAYSRARLVANLWRMPVSSERPATWADAQQLTFDRAHLASVDVSPDKKRLAVTSDRGGSLDVWTLPVGGGEMVRLTSELEPDRGAVWSPDGQAIAFHTNRGGRPRQIWVLPVDGGPARQLTQDDEVPAGFPAWSPDGRTIAFQTNNGIWLVPADGGKPRRLTSNLDYRPVWSPDGQWIVFSANRDGHRRLLRMPSEGGQPEELTDGSAMIPRWSRDGDEIFSIGREERLGQIWVVSLEDGTERPVTDFRGRRGSLSEFALATDGDYLYFVWEENLGDIWVMDVVQP